MYGALDTSTSALGAQRTHLDVIAGNIAMRETWELKNGEPVPFRRRVVLFTAKDALGGAKASGVRVAKVTDDPTPFGLRWDPHHPFAHKVGPNQGYVPVSNVDYSTEMVNAMTALRAYEANVSVIEMAKSMAGSTLRLLV